MEDRLLKLSRIVDVGSFTKAAVVLHVSQPALTTAIKKLERELGAELLVRGHRGLALTPAGRIAYDHAKAMHDGAQNLRLQLAEHAGVQPVFRLGMIDSLADVLFVHSERLQKLEQKTHLSLTIDNSARLADLVARDDLEVALIARPRQYRGALRTIDMGDEPLLFVAQTDQVALINSELTSKNLRHFLGYNQASHTYDLIAEHFTRQGVTMQPSFYSTSPEIILRLVLAGRGAAVLPYMLVKPHIDENSLTPVKIGESSVINRRIVAIHRTGRRLPAQADTLLARAQQELQEQLAPSHDSSKKLSYT
jgi:DNA-binding transcriptional LysR family regulator